VVVTAPGQPVPGRERTDRSCAPEPFIDPTVRRAQGRPDGHFRSAQDVLRQDVRAVRQRGAGSDFGAVVRPHSGGHGGPAQSQAAGVLCSGSQRPRFWVLRADGVQRHKRGDAPQHHRVLLV